VVLHAEDHGDAAPSARFPKYLVSARFEDQMRRRETG
jgi:hypothetical protein